ncbi:MAG TPA: NAD(P)H-dependent glycerol-3-phosphate dehydrogenase [Acidobacteriota bacterium]
MSRVAILGGGAWGTALAVHLARLEHEIRLWTHRETAAREMERERENRRYLPGIRLAPEIRIETALDRALEQAEVVVLAVPSHVCRDVFSQVGERLPAAALAVSAIKGIETGSLRRISQIMTEVWGAAVGARTVVLSGPSFAQEVARGDPTAVVLAAEELEAAERLQRAFSSRSFRFYTNTDVIGTELGGALKNVVAIAAGVLEGLGMGHNTNAALITRGLAEIGRMCAQLGGRPETVAGLAGLGDLVLTCTGALSRNRAVGVRLGRGQSLEAAQREVGAVAEGVRTTASAHALARQHGIEMPIVAQMHAVLYAGKPPGEAVWELMTRNLKPEFEG